MVDRELAAMELPLGYRLEFPTYIFFNEKNKVTFFWLLLAAIGLVYLVMAAVFESWSLPFVVMFSVPLGFIGVALGFLWTGANFAEGAFIGLILLIGIAVNDSILLVYRYGQLRKLRPSTSSGLLARLAVRQRLRPMWTTTLTSIAGMLPLLIFPEKGELWLGLAIAVVGGLLCSTLLGSLATVAILSLKKNPPRATPSGDPWQRSVRVEELDGSRLHRSAGADAKMLLMPRDSATHHGTDTRPHDT